jgi:small subunit ribosomal protein S17
MNEDLRFMAKEPENNEEVETPGVTAEDASASEAPRSPDAESEVAASDASASEPDATSEPEVSEEPAAEATSDADATPEPEAAEPEEAAAVEEPPAEPAAEEPAAEEPAAEAAPAAPVAEPVAVVPPKERRHLARAAKAAQIPARPPRTPEERQAERVAERQLKAKRRSIRRKQEREKARAQRSTTETPEPLAARPALGHGKQKTRQGLVVSDRATKTIIVRIDVARRHSRYQKIVRTSTTLHAHDEREDAHIGDTVTIQESRPLSRTKRWRLVEVLERAK